MGKNYKGNTLLVQAIFQEIIGSMIITFLYLTQTEEKTKMSGDPAITTLIIAATYTAVVSYSEGSLAQVMTGSPFNPAAAMGIMWGIIFKGNLDLTDHTWLFLIFSYVGSILAVVLFEFIYKRAMNAVEEVEGDDDDDERAEHDALISPTSK